MDLQPFPKLGKCKKLRSSLHKIPELKRLDAHLRFIYKGMARQNVAEFFVSDRNGIRRVMENCLQRPPPETVVVFDMLGQTEELQLRKDASGSGYVFSGPLIASIISNENEEIELWGYPYKSKARGVFVLTVGVSG